MVQNALFAILGDCEWVDDCVQHRADQTQSTGLIKGHLKFMPTSLSLFICPSLLHLFLQLEVKQSNRGETQMSGGEQFYAKVHLDINAPLQK